MSEWLWVLSCWLRLSHDTQYSWIVAIPSEISSLWMEIDTSSISSSDHSSTVGSLKKIISFSIFGGRIKGWRRWRPILRSSIWQWQICIQYRKCCAHTYMICSKLCVLSMPHVPYCALFYLSNILHWLTVSPSECLSSPDFPITTAKLGGNNSQRIRGCPLIQLHESKKGRNKMRSVRPN